MHLQNYYMEYKNKNKNLDILFSEHEPWGVSVLTFNKIKPNKYTFLEARTPKNLNRIATANSSFSSILFLISKLDIDLPMCKATSSNRLNHFKNFDFECTWWRLFQKRILCSKLDIYVFITVHHASHILTFFLRISKYKEKTAPNTNMKVK